MRDCPLAKLGSKVNHSRLYARSTLDVLGEIIEFFIIKQIKKPRLVLCSVVKHLESGRALKKWGKTLDCVPCFPLHFFRALPLPACFTYGLETVVSVLFSNTRTRLLYNE